MGKTERVPIAIIRGYEFSSSVSNTAKSLVRDSVQDLFQIENIIHIEIVACQNLSKHLIS